MISEPIAYLTDVGIILLIGIICSAISNKLKIPNILLLLLAGIGLGNIYYQGLKLISFPPIFLTSISILALVMIIFDSTSKLKIKEFDTFSTQVLKLIFVYIGLMVVFLSIATKWVFGINSWLMCILFAALMCETAPDVVSTTLAGVKSRVKEFIEVESIINTPFIIVLPFIVLDLMNAITINVLNKFIEEILPLLQQIAGGIGCGILVGLIVFKGMRNRFSRTLSPVAIITAALMSYILAEAIGGNGALSVITMGLFFGNVYIKQKQELEEFSDMFTSALEIFVFVLIGLTINIPWSVDFILRSSLLFVIALVIRFVSIELSALHGYTWKEKIFMTFNMQKGIAVAVIAFTLVSYVVYNPSDPSQAATFVSMDGALTILHLILAFLLYSIILSTLMSKLSRFFMIDQKRQIR